MANVGSRLFALAAFTGALFVGHSYGQAVPPDPAPRINQLLDAVSTSSFIVVDPAIRLELVADVNRFTFNFCYPPDKERFCARTIDDTEFMFELLTQHVGILTHGRPATLQALSEAMARRVSHTMDEAGWEATISNSYAVVDLGRLWQDVSLGTSQGYLPLGAGRWVILKPGSLHLLLSGPDLAPREISFEIGPRQYATLDIEPNVGNPGDVDRLGRVTVSIEDYCFSDQLTHSPTDVTEPFNWRSRGIFIPETPASRLQNEAPTVRQTSLDIVVGDQLGVCNDDCVFGLGAAFAHSIAVWRSGCERCDKNALAVMRLGTFVWMDAELARRMREYVRGDAIPDLNLRASGVPTQGAALAGSGAGYDEISRESRLVSQICGLASPQGWAQGAQEFLCGGPPASRTMSPHVTLMERALSCGSANDFLACGLPGGNIEIAMAGVGYRLSTRSGEMVLSSGPFEGILNLSEVVFHEVGHWFGVPHDEVVGANAVSDIMANTYGLAPPCMSYQSYLLLNNAQDLRWSYRQQDAAGLRRPG